jgi:DNA excision repair protein ERCC-4
MMSRINHAKDDSNDDEVVVLLQGDDDDDDTIAAPRLPPQTQQIRHKVPAQQHQMKSVKDDEHDNDDCDDDDEDDTIPEHTVPLYLQDAFTELYNEDGLLCIGKGLQYLVLLALFCKCYNTDTNTGTTNHNHDSSSSSPSPPASSLPLLSSPNTTATKSYPRRPQRRLPIIFVLGLKDEKERQTLLQILTSWGTPAGQLPIMITNESGQSKDREVIYNTCSNSNNDDNKHNPNRCNIICITSRILIVDLLSGVIQSQQIYGMMVVHAHTVTEQSTEAFILRIYKSQLYSQQQPQPPLRMEPNKTLTKATDNDNYSAMKRDGSGFIKAITDNADALISGFAQVDKILKALYVRKLYLYPRFHHSIRNELEGTNDTHNHNPTIEVIEYHQELSTRQKEIQSSIAVLVMQCLRQLKQQTEHLVQWSIGATTTANGNDPNDPLDENRGRLSLLTVENCVTQQFDIAISRQLEPHWYKLSPNTKQLVQDLRTLKTLFVSLIQYDCITFYKLLCSIRTISAASRYPSMWLLEAATDILFRQAKERVYTILHPQTGKKNDRISPAAHEPQTGYAVSQLVTILEENPKWSLLKTVLDEIQQDYMDKQANHANHCDGVTNVLVMVKDDKVLETIKAYLTDTKSNSGEVDETIGKKGARKRNRYKKSSSISKTPPRTLLMKWLRYLEHINDRSRNITDTRGSTDSLSEESRLLLEEEGRVRRILFSNTASQYQKDKSNRTQELSNQNTKKRRTATKSETTRSPNKSGAKVLNQIPSHVRQRRRIAVEKGRGQFSSDDIKSRSLLDEAVGITEHDMDDTQYPNPDNTVDDVGSLDDCGDNDGSHDINQEDRDISEEVMFRVSYPNNELRVVIHCYSMVEGDQSHLLLQDIRPKYVVFYDTEVAFIRAVEIYAALAAAKKTDNNNSEYMDSHALSPTANYELVRVYFLMFEASAEEKNYKKALEREQNAFERLIHHKKTMPVPVLQSMETQEMQEALCNSAGVAGTYMNGQYPLSVDTRRGKGKVNTSKDRRDIAVDVREFRSALPNILHQGGMRLAPVTLTVGDFVLSNVHCVERKSISDLFGSFASGRLYTQVEAMSKYYTCPCLLIEFDPNKSFCLQNSNELGIDIRMDSICSKIVLLVTHFPKLRILWSRTPQSTLNLFRDLKVNHEEVDVERAIEIGRNESEEYLLQPDNCDGEVDEINEAARDMLLQLPGVTVQSARRIMQECDSLAELSSLSRDELRRIAGPVTGQKLFTFFRQNISAA